MQPTSEALQASIAVATKVRPNVPFMAHRPLIPLRVAPAAVLYETCDRSQSFVEFVRELATGLGYVRSAAAAALHDLSGLFGDGRCVEPQFDEVFGHHRYDLGPLADDRADDDHAAAKLVA